MLVLDEATSALDSRTEESVMQAINALSQSLTVIMIAHRLSTIQNCDQIYFLENGVVADKGTFSELMQKSKTFSAMVIGENSTNLS